MDFFTDNPLAVVRDEPLTEPFEGRKEVFVLNGWRVVDFGGIWSV